MLLLDRREIERRLDGVDIISAIEAGFVAYSRRQAVIPPPGELIFDGADGETHIKYGYIKGEPHFVVKVASGFYRNAARGLPSSQGLVLLFSAETGEPYCLLQDEGVLTNIRTAVAGAIVAKLMAPPIVETIGLVGAGIQAELQTEWLQKVRPCRNLIVWNRNEDRAHRFKRRMLERGYAVRIADSVAEVCANASLIVTCTPSETPLVRADDVRPGTHITAVGADTPAKRELDPGLLGRASTIVVDSIEQCSARGEIRNALAVGACKAGSLVELGTLLQSGPAARPAGDITIGVLTGLAVQDLAIAGAVLRASGQSQNAAP